MENLFSIDQVKTFKQTNNSLKELVEHLLNQMSQDERMEDICFTYNQESYAFVHVGTDDLCSYSYWQLVSFDKSEKSYPTDNNIINHYNIIIIWDMLFDECFYYNDKPVIKTVLIETVPQVVVSEHEKIKFI